MVGTQCPHLSPCVTWPPVLLSLYEQRSRKSASLGAVYATVDRLEKKGLASSRLGESTPERGGKPKRYYEVTALGLLALSKAREANIRLWADAPLLGVPT